jgi:hypothetical protein
MPTIIINNGDNSWLLSDTRVSIEIQAGQQKDLEAAGLNRNTIALSDQLLNDIQNPELGLTVNDGTKDLDGSQAVRHILIDPTRGVYNDIGAQRVITEKTDTHGVEFISPNWGDERTWYHTSNKLESIPLSPTSNPRVYVPSNVALHGGPWVQANRGRYSNEEKRPTLQGDIPNTTVFEDGIELAEIDYQWYITPEKASPGKFVIDYYKGEIIFHEPPVGVITATVWKVVDSVWTIKPYPNTKLFIDSAEVQFSRDISQRDSIFFQTWGYRGVFDPQFNPETDTFTQLIPIDTKIYKTMMHFIDEANGALPIIHQTSNQNPTWRDLPVDVSTYPWNYRYSRVLRSSLGMEVRVFLERDIPFDGIATSTFYCLYYEED